MSLQGLGLGEVVAAGAVRRAQAPAVQAGPLEVSAGDATGEAVLLGEGARSVALELPAQGALQLWGHEEDRMRTAVLRSIYSNLIVSHGNIMWLQCIQTCETEKGTLSGYELLWLQNDL